MGGSINDIIANAPAGGTVTLPAGEFEGHLYINKPLHIIGSSTTIWSNHGNVAEIASPNVILENLRLELIGGRIHEYALSSAYPVKISNVEIYGPTCGMGAEDIRFDLPRSLNLGSFAADKINTYMVRMSTPVAAEICCNATGVSFSPTTLLPGDNEVMITVKEIGAAYQLYAPVLVKSLFTRRLYITGKPSAEAEIAVERRLPTEDYCFGSTGSELVFPNRSAIDVEPQELPILEIRKLQKISLMPYIGSRCDVFFHCGNPQKLEIDPYVFLLDDTGKSFDSRCLVFFGNRSSPDGSVFHHPESNHVSIDFNKIDMRTKKIMIVYSVYGGNAAMNFSSVRFPVMRLASFGRERIRYSMYNLGNAPTVVAAELYRYGEEWKMSAMGWSCREGLAELCRSYGIEVLN